MLTTCSIPPGSPMESVGALVAKAQKAVAANDTAAVERRFRRLRTALGSYRGLYRTAGLRDPDAADEARQLTLIKVHGALSRGHVPQNPEAWARTVARHAALDVLRAQRRHGARAAELDPERVPAPPPAEPGPDLDDLHARMFKLFVFCAFWARILGGRRRGAQRVKEVTAWYLLRVARFPVERVARKLGATALASGGRNAVYKWAQRGAAIAVEIAELNPDHEYSAVILRAAEARH